MFTYVLLAALAVAANANPVTLQKNDIHMGGGRIYGGEDTTIEEYPYQVSIQYGGRHICGGSIVSKHHILTAGHCISGSHYYYSIRAGTTRRNQGGQVYKVKNIVRHNKYYTNSHGIPVNDVALIRLAEAIEFDSTKQPVALFEIGEQSFAGNNAVVTGWGNTEYGSPTILQTVTVPIVDVKVCDKAYKKDAGGVPSGQICAGFYRIGGKDACQGDSGGPLAIQGRLAGIVSWGFGCARPDYPGVYTEVAYFRDWIEEHMQD